MPILPEIPTRDPVYFGPRSAWFTPNPPAQIPEQIFIRHNKIMTFIRESSREIKYKKIAEPKKPIEFTLLRTFKIPWPFLIKLSAKYPPRDI